MHQRLLLLVPPTEPVVMALWWTQNGCWNDKTPCDRTAKYETLT